MYMYMSISVYGNTFTFRHNLQISERRQRKGNRAEKGNKGEERGRGGGHTDPRARLREETSIGEEHKPSLH
jgi:hypothetical protein